MGHQTGSVHHSRAAVAFACAAIALVGGCRASDQTPSATSPATLAPVLTSAPSSASALAPASPAAPTSLAPSSANAGASTTTAASTTASSSPVPSTAASTTASSSPAPTTRGDGIYGVDFENFTYDLAPDLGVVTVVDGKWSSTAAKQRLGPESVDVIEVVRGDIDGDGHAEAAVMLAWSGGGTGRFSDVFVYRWDGTQAVFAARDGVGDRALDGVRSITVFNGMLQVDRYASDSGGACCPVRIVRRTLTLRAGEGRLAETSRARTFAYVALGWQGPGVTQIYFLPGTDRAFIVGTTADESSSGEFLARRGQTLRITVTGDESVDVVQGANIIGNAKQGAPLRLTLPVTGTYEIRPVVVAGDLLLRSFDAELTID